MRGIALSWWAQDLIQNVSLCGASGGTRIALVSGRELGIVDKGINTAIYAKALNSGLHLITPANSLILGCSGVKITDRIMSGMEPIHLTGGDPMIFTHWKNRLSASFALPDQMLWDAHITWAFELP